MSDSLPAKTTRSERSTYWVEVFDDACALSYEQFDKRHEILAGLVGLGVKWYVDDYKLEMAVDELVSIVIYVAVPMLLYLLGWFLLNVVRATVRVPVYRQREIARLTEELQAKPDPARSRKIERLQHHIMRGEVVTTQGRAKDRKAPLEQLVTQWEAEVKTDLHNFFSPSYIQCFLDSGDLPVYPGVEAGVTEEDKQTYLTLVSRIVRLRQFLAEVERGEG